MMPSTSFNERLAALPSEETLAAVRALLSDPATLDRLDASEETIAEIRALIADREVMLARLDEFAALVRKVRVAAAALAERKAGLTDRKIALTVSEIEVAALEAAYEERRKQFANRNRQ